MEWLVVIPILVILAFGLGSTSEKTREWRARARYTRWESTSQRRARGDQRY